jgi:uncharacterized protein (TIGR02145 family)
MKTFPIILLALFLSASNVMAQDTLYIYKAGSIAYKSAISALDSVTVEKVYHPIGPVTDIDGNVYQTVTIGTQTWMVENLRTTRYRNGDPITNVTDNAAWVLLYQNGGTGAWCDYDNDPTNSTKFGHLYNFYAVADARNIAPEGWHVATNAEWTTLANFLGGNTVAGGKLKESGILNWADPDNGATWASPNAGATNQSGFTARPGGYRDPSSGSFLGFPTVANYWTATVHATPSYGSWYRYMVNTDAVLVPNAYLKTSGFSVRCIMD